MTNTTRMTKTEKRAEFEANWRMLRIGPKENRARRNQLRAIRKHQMGGNWRHRNELLGNKYGREGRLARA